MNEPAQEERDMEIIVEVEEYVKINGRYWCIELLPLVMELVHKFGRNKITGHEKKDLVLRIMGKHVHVDPNVISTFVELFIAAGRGAYTFSSKNIFANLKSCTTCKK